MEDTEKPKSKAPKIFGLIIVFLILIYLAIIIPSLPGYRTKEFCSRAEADANNIAAAIADYFANPLHVDITRDDIEQELWIDNPWTLTRCGDNFYIHVVDRTGKCPDEIQNKDADWNAGIYTKHLF